MHCASCTARVESALTAVPGVEDARVNLANERAYVTTTPSVEVGVLEQAIEKAGFSIVVPPDGLEVQTQAGRHEVGHTLRAAIMAGLLTLPVFVLEMGGHLVPAFGAFVSDVLPTSMNHALQALLITLVIIFPGSVFYRLGLPALLRGAPDMNSLVALGTGAAWIYSICVLFFGAWLPSGASHVYFESAGVVITLVLLGRHFENKAKYRAGSAVRSLLNLQAQTAWVMQDGDYVQMQVAAIPVGATVRVKPGETIAVDGRVIEGASFVDESVFSGEPLPVAKHVDDSVTGGTLNKNGALFMVATQTGENTALAKVVAAVEYAQAAKLPIQGLTDKVVQWFVPIVLVIASLTFLLWLTLASIAPLEMALVSAVAVLIVACPCALGLATPTSILVGTGMGAKHGIIFRHGDALQTLNDVDVVAFDKTGTLTIGKPELTDLFVIDAFEENHVLQLVAAVEQQSEHPLAQCVVDAANSRGLSLPRVEKFNAQPGYGVSGDVEGQHVQIGSKRLMLAEGISTDALDDEFDDLLTQGKSVLCVALQGQIVAVIAVADVIKDSAASMVAQLQQQGKETVMLSGDNSASAHAVAAQLGITSVYAELLPEEKVEVLTRLQKQGRRVAFVGDGINDAPALVQADVGIAVGGGTDVAIESADVVVAAQSLNGIADALELSRRVMNNIKQNLFWAFFYNLLLIPIAAGVLYPSLGLQLSPGLAASAMALSSLFVVTNALRLNRVKLART